MDKATPTPTLLLSISSKEPLQAPLALAKYIATLPSSTTTVLPISVQWTSVEANEDAIRLTVNGGKEKSSGLQEVLKQIADIYASLGIAGKDSTESGQVAHYIDQAINKVANVSAFTEAAEQANELDQRISLRTYLVGSGHTLTVADFAIWGAFRSSPVFMGVLKKGLHEHLARWFAHIDKLTSSTSAMEEIASEKSKIASSAPKKEEGGVAQKQAHSFDIFLGDEAKEGQVVTRFPPEPSGYLHVGHAKAAILNHYFARKYKGKLIIRFDDTNPSKEKMEFEQSIIEDLALMGITADATSHTSDYFDELYRRANQMIKQGDAYCDDTEQEEMRAQRMDGIPSRRRDASIEENLERFAEMTTGSESGRKWCLRAKMSVDDPNKALRDPVIYRVNADSVHHHTGTTWKVYPTYDFACPIVDSIEGVTHALRTNEYRDRNPQYAWMLEKLKLRPVNIWDFGRLNFVYTLLSKRKLQWFVDNGHVTGWDDPRFPTIRGIRRRGMTVDCIQQFILATGPSQQVINMEWDSIWTINKKILDPVVPRFTAIASKDMVKCTINGVTHGVLEKVMPKHKKNPDAGTKTTIFDSIVYLEQEDAKSFDKDEEVTLMDWGNVFVRNKKVNDQGVVESLELDAHFEGDFKKTKKKVTWLATDENTQRKLTPIRLLDFDYLITKMKLEEDDKFSDFLTPQTIFTTDAVADFNVTELKRGDTIQFERKGYYILDNEQGQDGRREFIHIPDGKVESSKSKAAAEGEDTVARKKKAAEEREKKKAEKAKKEEEKAKKKAEKSEKKSGSSGQQAGEAVAAAATTAGLATATAVGANDAIAQAANSSSKMYKVKPVASHTPTEPKTNMYKVKPIM
ncbi:hypothetical protein L7F22_054008 [Adiantum nelumboides]|nr:hypothetical protein [Adiantum nelumboides]